ncbi:hypothetical protein LCGC14_3078490, partial [marine sediment metagenome]
MSALRGADCARKALQKQNICVLSVLCGEMLGLAMA